MRVCWLAGFVGQNGEDAVKMVTHGVFLPINPDVGVRA